MDQFNENTPVLLKNTIGTKSEGLSLFFAILCIVDLFGVFPIVALPKAIIDCGIYGIPVIICVFSIQIYAAILLGRCWLIAEEIEPAIKEQNRYPYAAVANLTYGPIMKNFVTILLDATIFGGGIPNLLVASQNLQLFGVKISGYQFDLSFCWWLVIIGVLLCPIMWLGSPKDMKTLSVVSVVFVSTVTIMVCYCIIEDPAISIINVDPAPPSIQEILIAYGIIAFQFDIHPMLMTIQVDMKHHSKISIAVIGGFFVTGIMFALTTILAAYHYGNSIKSNILQGLPPSLVLYVCVLLVTFQLCISSAIGSSALFQHIEDKLNIPRHFNIRRCIVRSLIVGSAVLLGEIVPRFDLVMSMIGSTLTGPLMFILPPLFYGKLLKMKSRLELRNNRIGNSNKYNENESENFYEYKTILNECEKKSSYIASRKIDICIAFVIMCFGTIVTFIATFYNWSNIIRYARFQPSCLINITANPIIFYGE